MKRRDAREVALCLLFDYSFNAGEDSDEILKLYLKCFPEKGGDISVDEIRNDEYISTVFYGAIQKAEELDAYIEKVSENWKPDRISRISRAILRLAIFEMLYMDDIPVKVSANEAVELAKKFDHENGFSFVNGILGKVAEEISDKDDIEALTEKENNEN